MFVFQMKEFCHVTCPFMLPGDVCVSNEGVLSCHMPIHVACDVCVSDEGVLSCHVPIVLSCHW